ncbi:LysE family translocator [Methanoplanus endosymbiosus]|uniref:LysE family translocator n=1 Tax=Methanoplanus endosymbiosus TaxID=33865 RepID=A0A9E7PPR5_9EURY|nr:LysE family translocator [Methanoplanus endosymbiosus]UUX93212.1 LysE family translocator [Methanoplanus endosymbiosus]
MAPGIIEMLIVGFAVGLTGALAPGPTLVAAINSTLKSGWKAGPLVTLGHAIAEIFMIVFILTGLYVFLGEYSLFVVIVGGIALIVFGALTTLDAKNASVDLSKSPDNAGNPVVAGIVTSASNPYFWIWWFTVGSALLLTAVSGGVIVFLAFIIGHWAADLGWFTLVSTGVHRGRFLLKQREYRILLTACGFFLIGFGIYFLISGMNL